MFEAVVFDYGRVISLDPVEESQEEMARLAGVPSGIFEKIRMKYRDDYDRGSMRGRDYYRKIMREAGAPAADARDFDALADRIARIDVHSWAVINNETEELMREIKGAGYRLGILSNMPHDFLELERDVFRVFDLCDPCIFSCRCGFLKPEREIYQVLVDALGCAPDRVVFFDDVPANVEGARGLGITAYLWQGAGTARENLKNLGILP
jgi:putative hydrolase of the HAD superfamily